MKRTQAALHLSKTPLIFVLAQVRFSPIANPESAVSKIQHTYREAGFSDTATRSFDVVTAAAAGVQRSIRQQWEFLRPDRTQSIVFDETSLVLQTTAYTTGDVFLAQLEQALKAVSDVRVPARLIRVGLRYVDLISPVGECGLDRLVDAALRAAAVPLPGEAQTHLWESLRKTSTTTKLLVRYTEAQRIRFSTRLRPVHQPEAS